MIFKIHIYRPFNIINIFFIFSIISAPIITAASENIKNDEPNSNRFLSKCENSNFRDNCADTEKLTDGTTYYGGYVNNKREGYGSVLFNDGSLFEGTFKAGWRLNGIQNYKNGGTYVGEFKDGKFHGKGKYTFPDSTTYEGQFQDGKYHGIGRLEYVNGDVYEGNFTDGRFSKHGVYKFNNGEMYTGSFANGQASGFGEHHFKDGTIYIGNFQNGKFSGPGIELIDKETISRQGIWHDGELIRSHIFDIEQLQGKLFIKSKSDIKALNSDIITALRSLRMNIDFSIAEKYPSLKNSQTTSDSYEQFKNPNTITEKLNIIKDSLPDDHLKEIKTIIIEDKLNDIQRMPIDQLKSKSIYLKNIYPSGHYFRAIADYYNFLYIVSSMPTKTKEFAKYFLNENNIQAIALVETGGSPENLCEYRLNAFSSYFTWSILEKDVNQLRKIGKRAEYALDVIAACLNSNINARKSFLRNIESYLAYTENLEKRLEISSLLMISGDLTIEENISIKRNRAHFLRSAQRFDDAEIEFKNLIKIAKDNDLQDWRMDLEIDYSILLIDRERFNEAEALLAEKLAQANVNGLSNWYKCQILNIMARSYQHRNDLESAITLLKSCIDIVDGERKVAITTTQISDKTFFANGFFGSFYENLAKLLIDSNRISEADAVLDLLKEEEQFEFIRRNNEANPRPNRIGYTATEQPWVNRYRQITDQLVALGAEEQAMLKQAKQGLTISQKLRLQAVSNDLAVARKAFEIFLSELRNSFVKQGPGRAIELLETNHQTLRETQTLLKELGDDTVLLKYIVTDDKIAMLLTTSGVQLARTTPIDSKEINRQIIDFRRMLRDPKSDTLPTAQTLYKLLLAPVEKDLEQAGAKTIMLSLNGALRYLPFGALHDGKRHLVHRWNMPMYTSVTKNKLRDSVTPQWQAAGLGLTRAVGEFAALPAVKTEISSIIRSGTTGVLPGEVYLDEAFNAARFKDVSLRKFQLLHVASHFQFSPGTEINSFLLLGDGQQLTLGDIRTQNYRFDNVDLLTLSACDTALGGGHDAQGREIEGFGVIAQQQGAKAVLATLWPVADQSTSVLMADMYKQRQEKSLTKVEALRQAQLSLLSQPKYSHPFYWAPFILMGNWK